MDTLWSLQVTSLEDALCGCSQTPSTQVQCSHHCQSLPCLSLPSAWLSPHFHSIPTLWVRQPKRLSAFDNGVSKGSTEPHTAISASHDNIEGRHSYREVSEDIPLLSGTTHLTCQTSCDSPKLPMKLPTFMFAIFPRKVWGVTCHQKMNMTWKK